MVGKIDSLTMTPGGMGGGGSSTCCSFYSPPWFMKQPYITSDDLELRVCSAEMSPEVIKMLAKEFVEFGFVLMVLCTVMYYFVLKPYNYTLNAVQAISTASTVFTHIYWQN